jgi:hypothetical protein
MYASTAITYACATAVSMVESLLVVCIYAVAGHWCASSSSKATCRQHCITAVIVVVPVVVA